MTSPYADADETEKQSIISVGGLTPFVRLCLDEK